MGSFTALALVGGLTALILVVESVPINKDWPIIDRRPLQKSERLDCTYKGQKYDHGERVETPEPCLNCTCIRALLVCYLKVCPTALATPQGCFQARELGQCCPTLVCGIEDLPTGNESQSASDLRPTFKPDQELTTSTETNTDPPIFTSSLPSSLPSSHPSSLSSSLPSSLPPSSSSSHPSSISIQYNQDTTTTDNSLLSVTSHDAWDNDLNTLSVSPRGCMVNDTLYGDGSAMLSNSFCEYCFCIHGKQTCLQPKCNLDIEGCVPEYDNEFTCCPSRYNCSNRKLSNNATNAYEEDVSGPTDVSIPEQKDGNCQLDSQTFSEGEMVPDHIACHNCYCSNSSIICEEVSCSPPIAGCQAIIPEGHCCPISYRCEYQPSHVGANIKHPAAGKLKLPKTAKRNSEEVTSIHKFEVDKKNQNVSAQSSTDRETFLSSQRSNSNRESDKTLKLEVAQETRKPEDQTIIDRQEDKNNESHFTPESDDKDKNATTGSPEIKTLLIHELFDRYFPTKKLNETMNDKDLQNPAQITRNNSKQPSSFDSNFDTTAITVANKETNESYTTISSITTEAETLLTEDIIRTTALISECEETKCNHSESIKRNVTNVFLEEVTPESTLATSDSPSPDVLSGKKNYLSITSIVLNSTILPFTFNESVVIKDLFEAIVIDSKKSIDTPVRINSKLDASSQSEIEKQSLASEEYFNFTPSKIQVTSTDLEASLSTTNTEVTVNNTEVSEQNTGKIDNLTKNEERIQEPIVERGNTQETTEISNTLAYSLSTAVVDVPKPEENKVHRIRSHSLSRERSEDFESTHFVAKDVIRGHLNKINLTSVVREENMASDNPDVVSDFCFIDGRIFLNGEPIAKSNPCEMCRCFYGREICQMQRCPTAPAADCTSDHQPGFCCPRYTCVPSEDVNKEEIANANIKFGTRVRPRPSISPSKSNKDPTSFVSYTISLSTDSNKTPIEEFPEAYDPWGHLQLSGCNIHGKYFNVNDRIGILSGACSHCICTSSGVECNDIC